MLYEFLKTNREELIARCRAKAAQRALPNAAPPASEYGVPQFLTQLTETFRLEGTPEAQARRKAAGPGQPSLLLVPAGIPGSAAKRGEEMRRQGLTIDEVVHNYGDLCQALTELALETDAPISVDAFHTFNRCLDDAIADAVSAYGEDMESAIPRGVPGSPAQEMRTRLDTAIHAFAAIKAGQVSVKGATSELLETTLVGLRELVDRS